MPKVHLRPAFVVAPPLPKGKAKIDYFDNQVAGFLLEVRCTGTSTYYLRYRDKASKIRQVKIGSPATIGLEEARSLAKTLKSQSVIGFDPHEAQNKIKAIPTFRDFTQNKYIPYVKNHKRSWKLDQTILEKRFLRVWGYRKLNEISKQDLPAKSPAGIRFN
ncbi:protein of unknown function [Desulfonatronum zhilinae]|nr:protein of unknown function [Desulfonatronum zhilinae]